MPRWKFLFWTDGRQPRSGTACWPAPGCSLGTQFRDARTSSSGRSPLALTVAMIGWLSVARRSPGSRRRRSPDSRPRMRVAIDVEQMRGVDRGIDLRRSSGWHGRAVPAASADRRRGRADASRSCGAAHAAWSARDSPSRRRAARTDRRTTPGDSGPPSRAAKQRRVARRPARGRARDIGLDRLAHLRQQRHDPRLVALAGHRDRLAQRQHRAGQRPAPRRCASPRRRAAAAPPSRARAIHGSAASSATSSASATASSGAIGRGTPFLTRGPRSRGVAPAPPRKPRNARTADSSRAADALPSPSPAAPREIGAQIGRAHPRQAPRGSPAPPNVRPGTPISRSAVAA